MRRNEEAVSPVIGVILMVAITVILAAVIAAFVFGMAGNIQKTKTVGFTAAKQGADTIIVTNMGGADVGALTMVNVSTVPNSTQVGDGVAVGSMITMTGAFTANTPVTVVGTFDDGSQQVLLDTRL
jgi:archaeal type IV pilus assembly protein PilA